MRFFRRSLVPPLPAAPTEAATNDSSEDLSAFLDEIETRCVDAELLPAQPGGISLTEKMLSEQGKAHKIRILSTWVACQSYLSQAEQDARSRQIALRMSVGCDDGTTLCDMASRSGHTSRTSISTMAARPSYNSLDPAYSGKRRYRFHVNGKAKAKAAQLQGFCYESYASAGSVIDLVHDDSARIEEEWNKLEQAWKTSLHLPGPKVLPRKGTKPLKKAAAA